MITKTPLPMITPREPDRRQLRWLAPTEQPRRRLPRVTRRTRSGPLLHPSPVGDPNEVLSLNLASGCAHGCSFCSVRAAPNYIGDEVVYLYADMPKQLSAELARRRKLPRAVYISPSTDPFPPIFQIQEETVRVVETLAHHGVESWLMTRGYIRPFALRRLAECRPHVQVTVALATLDRRLQRVLEPLAAPPGLRLRQVADLNKLGINVQVALEPLVPGLTDTPHAFREILGALATAGVQRVTSGYLFLRPAIKKNLERAFKAGGVDPHVLDVYADGPILKSEGLAAARYLPKRLRQRGYASLMAVAAEFGITVRISAVTNPDFQAPQHRTLPALPRLSAVAS